jgi:aspartyl protease family protein
MDADQIARVVYLGLLLMAVGGWVLVEYRARLGQALRVALAWGMIFLGVAAGYGLWGDLRRDIRPDQIAGADQVEIPRSQDGHYYLRLEVNGRPVTFMADTGASGITLSGQDAADLGIDPAALTYLGRAVTANGEVRTARITLPLVALGPFRDQDVTAFVTDGEMEGSLLGMDYLGLFSIEMAGDRMILRR